MKSYFIIAVFLLASCASIKKNKQIVETTDLQSQTSSKESTVIDSVSNTFKIEKITNTDNLSIVVEETISTKQTIDSSGVKVIVPVVKTKKTTYSNVKVNTQEKLDTSKVSINTQQVITKDSITSLTTENTLNLQKESEGIKIIEEVISGIIGGSVWRSAIFAIIALILIVVLFKKLKQNKNETTN